MTKEQHTTDTYVEFIKEVLAFNEYADVHHMLRKSKELTASISVNKQGFVVSIEDLNNNGYVMFKNPYINSNLLEYLRQQRESISTAFDSSMDKCKRILELVKSYNLETERLINQKNVTSEIRKMEFVCKYDDISITIKDAETGESVLFASGNALDDSLAVFLAQEVKNLHMVNDSIIDMGTITSNN